MATLLVHQTREAKWLTKEAETVAGVALEMLYKAGSGEVRRRDIERRLVDRKLFPRGHKLHVIDVMAELSYSGAVKSRIVLGPPRLGGDVYYRLTEQGRCGLVRQSGVTKVIPAAWDGGVSRSLEQGK